MPVLSKHATLPHLASPYKGEEEYTIALVQADYSGNELLNVYTEALLTVVNRAVAQSS